MNILYTLNHNMILLPKVVNNAFLKYNSGDDYFSELKKIRDTIILFNELEISNENLNMFRNELSEGLKIFADYFEACFNALDNNILEAEFENASEISKNAQKIYDAMLYMQKYYLEYDLTIDFSPTTDYVDVESTYEIKVDENNNVEVIGENQEIIE